MDKCQELVKKCNFDISTVELNEILECVNKEANARLVDNMMEIHQLKEAMSSFIIDAEAGSQDEQFIYKHYREFKSLLK